MYQSAYRPGYSLNLPLQKCTVMQAVNQGHCVFLVLLDLSAAFDTVSHDILPSSLHRSLGISENVSDWISSYLTNCTQCVLINGKLSEPSVVKHWVPQVSDLDRISLVTTMPQFQNLCCLLASLHNAMQMTP